MVADMGVPAYQGYLNDHCVTLAEALKLGGYRTAMSGKWHVGEKRPHWPTDRGFDHYFGLITGADNYFRPVRQMAIDDQPYKPDSAKYYMTDAITEHAMGFLDSFKSGKDPFLLYVAYTAPHWPLHAWPEDIAKYRGKYKDGWDVLRQARHERQMAMGIVDKKWAMTPRDETVSSWDEAKDKDDFDLRMSVYAAQIDRLDQDIGKLLARLKDNGQEDNTLVLFLADNGGCAEEKIAGEQPVPAGPAESFTSYGKPWANASNTPFRLYKHWVHEGGISSPFIASWPAVIKKGNQLHHQPAHLTDVMATFLDVAQTPYPKTYQGREITPLEGKSLLATFQGKPRPAHDPIFWEHEGNRAIREGRWKLVSRFPNGWELYDIQTDRTELHNVAEQQPERVKHMTALWEQWAARCGVVPWEEIRKRQREAARPAD